MKRAMGSGSVCNVTDGGAECAIQADHRIPGYSRYRMTSEEAPLMVIPDEVRLSVVFISALHRDGSRQVEGTGILLARKATESLWFQYLVTARHVIDGIVADGNKISIRLNTQDGSSIWLDDIVEWFYHPDENVDLAARGFVLPENADHLFFPLIEHAFVTRQYLKDQGVGPGDDVFISGLFWPHHGTNRNLPIIRVGNIAAMPEEKIMLENQALTEAFLIEVRSIGGLSGSPVFLHLGIIRQVEGKVKVARSTTMRGGHITFLGIFYGHYPIKDLELDTARSVKEIMDSINAGIGIVTPAWAISEMFSQPKIVANEQKTLSEHLQKSATVADNSGQP